MNSPGMDGQEWMARNGWPGMDGQESLIGYKRIDSIANQLKYQDEAHK